MEGLECCDICHTTPPTSEPVSRSRICKADFSLEQGEIDSCHYSCGCSARMPKSVNRKRGGAKQFWNVIEMWSAAGTTLPKVESRVLVFEHSPDKSICPVSGVLHPGLLMEFVFATGWVKEQNQTKCHSEVSHSRCHLPHQTSWTAIICLSCPVWFLHFLLTVAQLSTKRVKGGCLP